MEPTSVDVVTEQTPDGKFVGRYKVFDGGKIVVQGKTIRAYETQREATDAATGAAQLEWQTRERR